MIKHDLEVDIFDLVAPLAKTVDMMCAAVADHHLTVAYLALRICQELDFSEEEQRDIVIAAALHDIGAFSLDERLDMLAFEYEKPAIHSLAGYFLLRGFGPFEEVARLIKHHHLPWNHGDGAMQYGEHVARGNQVLHLADRIAVLIPDEGEPSLALPKIRKKILELGDAMFVPEYVDAFLRISEKEHIWLEVHSENAEQILRSEIGTRTQKLNSEDLVDFARLMCKVIDFKSGFTATHSRGVVASSLLLAEKLGFSEEDYWQMEVAACLHDVGKLAIPLEILEKPAKLDDKEWPVMQSHVSHSYHTLEPIKMFDKITPWGALHHERLNASGYPFGYSEEEISLGSRIIAVADVFTAITENRPYRQGMTHEEAEAILLDMAAKRELDDNVVKMLVNNFDEFNGARQETQNEAAMEYQEFRRALGV